MAVSLRRIGNSDARLIPVAGCIHGAWLQYLGRESRDVRGPGNEDVSIYEWLRQPN